MRDDSDYETMQRRRDREDFDRERRFRDRGEPRGAFFGGDMRRDSYGDPYRERERFEAGRRRERFSTRSDQRDPKYGSDAYREGIPIEETRRLIASDKVEGTPVYDRFGEKLGTIQNFMVDKRSGQVMYAVLRHSGGFLGLGERFYPLDWRELTYDRRIDGYGVELTEDDLEGRRHFDAEGRWGRSTRGWRSERERSDW